MQVVISYSPDQVEVSGINYDGSAFEIQAESKNEDGVVRIGRAQINGVRGRQLVAKLNVVAKQDTGTALLQITEESLVLRSSDSTNILKDRTGASYKLQAE